MCALDTDLFRTATFGMLGRTHLVSDEGEAGARECYERLPRFERRFEIEVEEGAFAVGFLARIV